MPRLRRLRDPRHASRRFMPELGHPAGADRLRHRASAAPAASSTTWTPTGCTASTAARRRSRPGVATLAAGPLGLGGERRRRRALDRRQPPDPRAAPQRADQDPALQQPDLRPDQGPVLADQRGGQGHQVDAVRLRRTTPSTRSRWRSAPRRRFVARTVDTDKKHVAETLRAAAEHQGSAFVEIYQNCNVFNDGAFDAVRAKGQSEPNQIRLEHGKPIRFGAEGERGVVARRRRPARARRRRRGRRGRAARPRRPPRRPEPRVRAGPPGGPPDRPDADRRLPRRRAPGLRRGAVGASSRRRARRSGTERARGAAALRRTWTVA